MILFLSKGVIPRFIKKIINVIFYRGYSCYLKDYSFDRKVVKTENNVIIKGSVENNGWHKHLTAYIVFKIIDPYEPDRGVFNSDFDLSFEEKRNLLVHDIEKNDSKTFAFTWTTPDDLEVPVLYITVEVWSPRKLFRKKSLFYYPFLFDTSGWKRFVELIKPVKTNTMVKIFLSYAWLNEHHRKWVFRLADLLVKHGYKILLDRDMLGGQEITRFMERSVVSADLILLICSQSYTEKANSRTGGAGYETIIVTKKYFHSTDKGKYIPITRDNPLSPEMKIPDFLGTAFYIDMDVDDWEGESFQKLLQTIRSKTSKGFA